jgi:hypothetical protein
MLELICQQRYRVSGIPIDLSPYRNHGSATDAPGLFAPELGHNVIRFPNADSLVSIPPGQLGAWAPLGALRIEVTAQLDPHASLELALAEGHGAFLFYVNQGVLAASLGADYLRAADDDSPDGLTHPVAANRWTKLVLEHDGFAKICLFMDGRLVAEKLASGGVPSIQGSGVAIGNRLNGGWPLKGQIDEVVIWRLDPNEMRREFLCRPFTAGTVRCWEALFAALRKWIAAHPAQASSLIQLLQKQLNDLVRGLYLLPEADQVRARTHLNELARLWCAGNVDGPSMSEALQHWIRDVRRWEMAQTSGAAHEIKSLLADLNVANLTLECDPVASALLQRIHSLITAADGEAH